MKNKSSGVIIFLLLVIIGILLFNTFRKTDIIVPSSESIEVKELGTGIAKRTKNRQIDELTSESVVVSYVQENDRLPDYYITKKVARSKGWVPSKGNLCDVLPGRAIGGDVFTNRERKLPVRKGRIYYEADLNYNCGRRNADRLVFSNDGLIFVTHDHYKTFEKQ
ncbi:MAG: ribonuclease [Bacteroidales bacterium]|nr:ribonuclease [Bacteroidales bacterium]